jgi:MFS transporter, DHA3 family, macrolide efflux protein
MQRFDIFSGKRSWMAPFFTIWTGQAFSLLGSQLVQFALIWWLTKTTGSATVLATASLVGLLPQVLLSPVAGAMVDRWSRRAIMMLSDGTVALATLALAGLFLSGRVEIWQVYLAMLVRAMAGSFHWPAMQASTSLMVPKENLARVQGVNQILMGGIEHRFSADGSAAARAAAGPRRAGHRCRDGAAGHLAAGLYPCSAAGGAR